MPHIIEMALAKETKGTVVYEADPNTANVAVRSVYVQKSALNGARPKTILVTVDLTVT